MPLTPFYTDNGSVYIVGTGVTEKEFKGVVQELKVNYGDRDVAVEHTFSDSFVNSARPDMAEITITMVASGGDLPLYLLGGSGANVYPRSYTGDSSRVKPDIKYLQYDESLAAQKMFVASGCYVTSIEESNATGEATTWDVTAKTLAKNLTWKWTPNATASGLPAI